MNVMTSRAGFCLGVWILLALFPSLATAQLKPAKEDCSTALELINSEGLYLPISLSCSRKLLHYQGFTIEVPVVELLRPLPYRFTAASLPSAVVLGGGPGAGGMTSPDNILFWAEELWSQERYGRIILYDAPGTPETRPQVLASDECSSYRALASAFLSDGQSFPAQQTQDFKAFKRCAASLAEKHQGKSALARASSSQDPTPSRASLDLSTLAQVGYLESLLLSLDIRQTALIGISYGSRVADVADGHFKDILITERVLDGYYPVHPQVLPDDPGGLLRFESLALAAVNWYRSEEGAAPVSAADFTPALLKVSAMSLPINWLPEDHYYAEQALVLNYTNLALLLGNLGYDSSSWWGIGEGLSGLVDLVAMQASREEMSLKLNQLLRKELSFAVRAYLDPQFDAVLWLLTECSDRYGVENAERDALIKTQNRETLAAVKRRLGNVETRALRMDGYCAHLDSLGMLPGANYALLNAQARASYQYSPRTIFAGAQDVVTPLSWSLLGIAEDPALLVIAGDTAHSVIYHGTCDRHWTDYLSHAAALPPASGPDPTAPLQRTCNPRAERSLSISF